MRQRANDLPAGKSGLPAGPSRRGRTRLTPEAVARAVVILAAIAGCDRKADPAPPAPSARPDNAAPTTTPHEPAPAATAPTRVSPRIVSLVPAATDLLLGMGLGGHLVGVSTYCRENPDARSLPVAGDYQTTDWERLAGLRPDLLLVFMDPARLPPGMRERADGLGIRIENIRPETVADVLATVTRLGDLAGEPAVAAAERSKLEQRLAAVRTRSTSRPAVATLLVLGPEGTALAGPGGFLDELLTTAGGTNAAAPLATRYPTVDEERLGALAFDRVIVLIPGGTPAQVAAATAGWQRRLKGGNTSARVTVFTDWYLLRPGPRLAEVAEAFERALHSTGPAAGGAP